MNPLIPLAAFAVALLSAIPSVSDAPGRPPQDPQGPSAVHVETAERRTAHVHDENRSGTTHADLTYGTATWRPQYASYLESRRDRHLRLGSGAWSTFTNTTAVLLGAGPDAPRLPAGVYGLGLRRTGAGDWFLTFTRMERLLARQRMPGRTREVVEDHRLPLALTKAQTAVPDLTIEFDGHVGMTHAEMFEFELKWDTLRLNGTAGFAREDAPIQVPWYEPEPATPSALTVEGGVRWRVEQFRPRPADIPEGALYEFSYTLWSSQGRLLDSSHARTGTLTSSLEKVADDWHAPMRAIGPGSRVRLWTDKTSAVIDLIGVDY